MREASRILLVGAVVAVLGQSCEGTPPVKAQTADRASTPPRPRERARRPRGIPDGPAISSLSRRACERILRSNRVRFERVDEASAPGVEMPLRLEGPVGEVDIRHHGRGARRASVRRRIRRLEIMDCRLVVALLAWTETLRAHGVRSVDHYSAYRPNARVGSTGRESGHATGLAIDVGSVRLDDERSFVVDTDWTDKRRGAPPCPPREDEAEPQRVLRELVCEAVASDIFQVVLTPHHDEHHQNHVHLELRGDVSWRVLE